MQPGNCPVCQARFRGAAVCSRCGADLGRLMALAAQAWRLRAMAARALENGDYAGALEIALRAERIHASKRAAALRAIAVWAAHADHVRSTTAMPHGSEAT